MTSDPLTPAADPTGVAQHKGWVDVESIVGRGSTFRVFLPATPVAPVERKSGIAPAAPGGNETILLVEDDPMVRRMVSLSLRRVGYHVLEACSGREAIEIWEKHGPGVDLLFTDMVMPEGTNGMDLAHALRRAKPGLKVILSSGYSAEMISQSFPPEGGIVFLPKPYLTSTLCATVRECLGSPS